MIACVQYAEARTATQRRGSGAPERPGTALFVLRCASCLRLCTLRAMTGTPSNLAELEARLEPVRPLTTA